MAAAKQLDEDNLVLGGKSFTALAINCASKAGEYIKLRLGQAIEHSEKQSVHDLVTEVDKASEMLIRNLILTHFPDHEFLGEEDVEPGPDASSLALQKVQGAEYLWVVDPLDGTTNFVHGFPYFSVSIALAYRGEVVLGVVYDPMADEMFVAERGKGAYVKGKPMRVSKESELHQSLVATGFPADPARLPLNLRGLQALAPRVRNIRSMGSAALMLAYVAAGRLSGFWELGLNAWDLAAGSLLVREAGGTVTDTSGTEYDIGTRHVVASNGFIHPQLIDALQQAHATGFE